MNRLGNLIPASAHQRIRETDANSQALAPPLPAETEGPVLGRIIFMNVVVWTDTMAEIVVNLRFYSNRTNNHFILPFV